MPSSHAVETFIRSLAFLRREFLGRNYIDFSDDETSATKNSRTIFFYDTAILKHFFTPWESAWGPTKEKRKQTQGVGRKSRFSGERTEYRNSRPRSPGAGEIIAEISPEGVEDGEDRAIHTLSILCEHALVSARNQRFPIYQFPCQFDLSVDAFGNLPELARQLGTTRKTRLQSHDQSLRFAAAHLAAFQVSAPPDGQLLPIIEQVISRMEENNEPFPIWSLDQGTRSTPTQVGKEYERYNMLNAMVGGIFPASEIANQNRDIQDPGFLAALKIFERPLEGEQAKAFQQVRSKILKAIPRDESLGVDESVASVAGAEAVAWLYVLNEALKKSDWRAVLVTGSDPLADATYSLTASDPDLDPEISRHFSRRFVRHYSAYTTEALLEPSQNQRVEFINWLDGLLAVQAAPDGFKESI